MKKKLSTRQFDIMNILWNTNKPLLASEIVNSNHELTINTVQSALKGLTQKNYVKVAGITHSGKVLARLYEPIITKEDYLQDLYQELETSTTSNFVLASLIKQENDIDKLNELENIILERKERLEK